MVATQLSLPFAAPALPPRDLYFFALRPDDPARVAIAELARFCRGVNGLPERSIAADRLHASLLVVEGRQGFRRGAVAMGIRKVAPAFYCGCGFCTTCPAGPVGIWQSRSGPMSVLGLPGPADATMTAEIG
ncbi:hypothetical protein ACFOGJ_09510 [Marinibaculum pumilum]|uniref:2'-5' RNA ligase n=1 Tax=Marinibaculum pumilum TaxID=1766165 RepID=A0ABV7KZC5_9PROT